MSKRKRLKHGTVVKAKTSVSISPAPWNGDHGTGTPAANVGTVVREVLTDDGRNPNRMAQRVRVNVIDTLTSLTLRQVQAAKEIQNAYGKVESLSSGGPLKEQVQSSPKPDAVISAQVDAQSRLARAMKAVLRSERQIVEHICWHNERPQTLTRTERRRWLARFQQSMDRVADHLRY
ncbi:hypothetical protein JQV19_08460 [Sulfitobacter mediterraneus]|uniref:hypothetical protein n=1 Tax=Sulfitobacter mediterraneus TaxID=83219 RepID=UPI001939BCAC|nr:hypothetical protein [Sulfitobacter mediterraneus]MBM1556678.1 hypothetical protein [Sulfitobacter mediterraneus]MBM1570125.1 hypothetical protein [Sulfitobacter mediterraneus]MBM1574082.1 hypothetical protein [Sulfitobacter mediterraneus]MBM1577867.1 hypothetical protein [Sulfitobacter mediterraneus]MBM1579636.1 hypothetical protein [Sulfitobacter mediterraneus]